MGYVKHPPLQFQIYNLRPIIKIMLYKSCFRTLHGRQPTKLLGQSKAVVLYVIKGLFKRF